MFLSSVFGILIGLFCIIGTFVFESNSIAAIIQPSAALIVFGCTFGAVLLNFSYPALLITLNDVKSLFVEEPDNHYEIMNQIISFAEIARHEGLLALQELIPTIENDFLRKSFQLCLDTNNVNVLQDIFNKELELEEENSMLSSAVLESMGGYAPTFGIVGAVLGLIQVMSSLENPSQLGHGIATAFVATLYGVGSANIIFLPLAGRLQVSFREKILFKQIIIQGILSIYKGENPKITREKLFFYFNTMNSQKNPHLSNTLSV